MRHSSMRHCHETQSQQEQYLEAIPLCQQGLQLSQLLLQIVIICHEVLGALNQALNAGALAEGPASHLGSAADLLQRCHPYLQLLGCCL